jgi:tetratricopeptide (TPR) repeat protein
VALQVLPLVQSPDYSFNAIPLVGSVSDPRFVGVLAGSAAVLAAALRPALGGTPLPLALFWYGAALLPVSNLLLVSGTIFAERTLYLPSVATALLAGWGLAGLVRWHRPLGTGLGGLVLLLLAGQTVRYSGAWTDDVTLFRRAAAAVPESTKAHHKLGEELLRRGDFAEALSSLHRSLEIAPENVYAAATLAVARTQVASRYYGSEGLSPDTPAEPEVLYALGAVALERADTASAVAVLERAVAAQPDLARGWLTLASIRLGQGRNDAARAALQSFLAHAGTRYGTEVAQARQILSRLPPP